MASNNWCSAKFTMILLITALSFLALSSMMPTATASPEKMMEFFGEANKFASQFAKAIDSTFSAYFGGSYFPKKCYPANAIRLHNWGGNFMFDTQNIQYPRTVAEVQQIVRGACKLRVLGSRHSYSEVANSDDTLLSTLGMNSVISYNASVPSVTVQGGITYTDLTPALYVAGYALSNTVALAEVTVAGATQTGSHGSGVSLSSLPTQVRSMQLVLANGTVANYGPGSPELKALACGLGAFGVITQLELKLEPTYNTTSYVFLNMPAANLYANFDAINRMGYNVNMVTFMANTSVWSQVTITTRAGTAQNAAVGNMTSLFGATRSFAISAPTIVEINKEQPWYQGLLNFRLGTSGTDGNEIQTEYFVPYANAVPAIKAMGKLLPTVRTLATVHLIRTIAGDDLWMSEMYGNGTKVAIHFTWQNNMTALVPLLGQVEAALEPFGAIPHWGKFHTMSAKKFLKYYPKLSQFKQLARQLDPTGKFRNKYLDENVFARV